jgi:hypothetical protein
VEDPEQRAAVLGEEVAVLEQRVFALQLEAQFVPVFPKIVLLLVLWAEPVVVKEPDPVTTAVEDCPL